MVDQCFGEGGVVIGPIRGELTRPGGEGDHGAGAAGVYGGKAAGRESARFAPDLGIQPVSERIVAAGVDENEADLGASFDRTDDVGQRQRLARHVELAGQLRLSAQQVVVSLHLHAVSGEIEEGGILRLDIARERRQRLRQHPSVAIEDQC